MAMRVLHRVNVCSEGQPIDEIPLMGGAVVWPRPHLPLDWVLTLLTRTSSIQGKVAQLR
jgi:hypothetical protein